MVASWVGESVELMERIRVAWLVVVLVAWLVHTKVLTLVDKLADLRGKW